MFKNEKPILTHSQDADYNLLNSALGHRVSSLAPKTILSPYIPSQLSTRLRPANSNYLNLQPKLSLQYIAHVCHIRQYSMQIVLNEMIKELAEEMTKLEGKFLILS